MPQGIRVRKAETGPAPRSAQGNMMVSRQQETQQQLAQMGQQGMAGNTPVQAGTAACLSCGTKVTPRVDALTKENGEGPFCPNCWAQTWISHKYRGIDGGPPCSMGVRFKDSEWRQIQTQILGTMRDVGARTGRFPTPGEMDVVLGQFKFSQVCTTCKGNIAYALDSNDLKIAGINQPWPAGRPVPWAVR
jgi:hypothetical protein